MKKLLLLLTLFLVSNTLFGQKTWKGTTSSDWTIASNWQPAGMPSETDDIVIPAGVPNSPVVLTGASVSFRSIVINLDASLSVQAGASMTALNSPDRTIKIYGTLTNNGTITITNGRINDEDAGAVEIHGGVLNNYGIFSETGTIKWGIVIFIGKVTNFSGGHISVDNPIGLETQANGSFMNESGAELQARGTKYGIFVRGEREFDALFENAGMIICQGDFFAYRGVVVSQCATLIITGSLRTLGDVVYGTSFQNFGLTAISGKIISQGYLFNHSVLKYGSLEGNPDVLFNQAGLSLVINNDLTFTPNDRFLSHEIFGVFRDAEGVELAGTYDLQSGFTPASSLPAGRQTLYMAVGNRNQYSWCTYWVPCTYVNVAVPGKWLGNASTEWELPANWSDGVVPGPTTNVTIPFGTINYPVIYSSTATANDIDIAAGATLTLGENALLDVKGNITGGGTFSADASEASVRFTGLGSQSIHGGNYTRISISGGVDKTLGGNVTVNDVFSFSGSSKLLLGDHTLTIGNYATISGYDATNHFVTDGTGGLKRDGINNTYVASFTFPIGSGTSYTPIAIYNFGTEDNFTARVIDGVYKSYVNEAGQGSWVTDKVVGKTWFISEQVPGESNVALTFSWNSSDELGSFARDKSLIAHYKNARWEQSPPTTSFQTDLYSVLLGGVTSFSPFAISNSEAALPVTLARFDAVREGSTALLSWSTTEETNSDHFEVERSVNGKNWQNIGNVRSNGESKAMIEYKFVDVYPVSSQENLYRLRMVDKDGTFAYSRIRNLKFDSFDNPVVFPNPVSDKLFVQDFTNVSSLHILDMNGKMVHKSGKMENDWIKVNKLSAGLHLVEIKWLGGRMTTQKIVVSP